MEIQLRAALIDWLRDDPALSVINSIEEESPLAASPPWLGLSASAATDWSTKDRVGREIRIALELESRGDEPDATRSIVDAIQQRVETLPRTQTGFVVVNAVFLRTRSEKRANNLRGTLLEYRFRTLETPMENTP